MSIARLTISKTLLWQRRDLLVVAIVEGRVSDAEVGLGVVSVAVLTVALEKSESSNEVSFLQKVTGVGQLHLFLHRSN